MIVNEELKKANESQNNILLSLSHEVRNPLNIISGSAQIAMLKKSPVEILSYLETIVDTVELTSHLLNNLLYGSKMINDIQIKMETYNTGLFMKKVWGIC
jgi:signal transduction histidine kinase